MLRDAGYFAGYTHKGWAPGNPGMVDGRPRELTGREYSTAKAPPPTPAMSSTDYASNFRVFLDDRPSGRPFCFWYGCGEPHRPYTFRSGIELGGKKTADIGQVCPIWPDNEIVRTDLLDYGLAIEHYDSHLGRMLELLESRGELDDTIVVVTSDHGPPFPLAKGQAYHYSNHLPLAMMWKNGIAASGRVVDDHVSFIDFAPTFLEAAGVDAGESGMHPITGRSLFDIITSDKSGIVSAARDRVLVGKERHDVGRPHDWGYPIRGLVRGRHLYLVNFEPSRWPACNPETGYLNCDGSPTKTEILKARHHPETRIFWERAFGRRPSEELYDIEADPACLNNLAAESAYEGCRRGMRQELFKELRNQSDPRVLGAGDFFERIPVADPLQANLYERYMNGERPRLVWVNDSDFEVVTEEAPPLDVPPLVARNVAK